MAFLDDRNSEKLNPATEINIERIFDGISTTTPQLPSGLGPLNSHQIDFGPAINGPLDLVQMDINGTITVNIAGTYRIKVALQFGRSGASGISSVLFRVRVNDVQAGRTIATKLNDDSSTQYFENDTWITLPAGTVLKFDIMRDAAGSNFGGLYGFDPTVDAGNEWNEAPSAAIRVERWI